MTATGLTIAGELNRSSGRSVRPVLPLLDSAGVRVPSGMARFAGGSQRMDTEETSLSRPVNFCVGLVVLAAMSVGGMWAWDFFIW